MTILDRFRMDGKKIYVTGAGRGIGKACAFALCEAGADVAFIALEEDEVAQAAKEAADLYGGQTIAIKADISKPDEIDMMFDKIIGAFGTLDACFNNAGICNAMLPAEDLPYETIREIVDVNLIGTYLCCQKAAKIMIPKKSGSILNMASMSAHIVNVPQKTSHYAVTKAGVITLSKNLAAEWAPYNVRVNSLSPGYTLTELARSFSEELITAWKKLIPMERLQDPDELAGTVLYALSDASTYTTGCDIIVDGGYSLW